jgi:hypothetical protein
MEGVGEDIILSVPLGKMNGEEKTLDAFLSKICSLP